MDKGCHFETLTLTKHLLMQAVGIRLVRCPHHPWVEINKKTIDVLDIN